MTIGDKLNARRIAKRVLVMVGITVASLAVIGLAYRKAERHASAAQGFATRGLWNEAASEYEKATRNFPFKGGYYLRRAECFESLGDAENAAKLRKRARLLGARGSR